MQQGGLDEQHYEVLDDQGHKTGQLLDTAEVHKQGLWHETVNVWIMNPKGEVLLQLRAPNVELAPGTWDVAVGTHVRPSEDPANAALRCLQSEVGITVTPNQLKHLFNIQSATDMPNGTTHRVLGHVFLLKRDLQTQDLTYDQDKITELTWQPIEAVMAEVGGAESVKKYFPRPGDYFPQLFDALMAEQPL
ncbi:MAG TPA: NUDIX domain-containing protein [Candidatus Saccharimonadales bacterium]|nr:NUDIX domain-containing protein [Candidatus Saccharimonadales bacterium]